VEPDKVRLSLKAMLDDLRGAREGSPRPQETMRLNRLIFLLLSNWLPPGERDQMRLDFERELRRLNLAA
jgi:hypothetical protein